LRKIAILGSRKWHDPDPVISEIASVAEPFILYSGGAPGVSTIAEQYAISAGIPVCSLRPVEIDYETFVVEEWRIRDGHGRIIRHPETWADWKSAAGYRSWLISERATECIAFWDGYSMGTKWEIEFFRCHMIEPTIVKPAP